MASAPVPLYAIDQTCLDERYPALAGPWAVGCGPGGLVDRALSLQTGALVMLPLSGESPGLGPSTVYFPGRDGGLIRLQDGVATLADDITRVVDPLSAPPVTDGEHVALAGRDHVQAFEATQRQRTRVAAHPAGWYPPALAWPTVAWVEDSGADGEDIWAANMQDGRPVPLSAGPGYQRHVVGQGRWLAWVEDEALVILDTADMTRVSYSTQTGFYAPPTLWEGVACYETRDGADIDIRCTDGVEVARPGDQRWPSRADRWLLYRQDGRPWLLTLDAP